MVGPPHHRMTSLRSFFGLLSGICPQIVGAETFHASTSPASFIPCARPQAKRCSTTSTSPNHCRGSECTFSETHSLPWEVIGQNTNTVPSLRTRTSGVIGTTEELLICVLLVKHASGTEKPPNQAAMENVCISAASGRSPYHRALQVGWSRFRAVLMLRTF